MHGLQLPAGRKLLRNCSVCAAPLFVKAVADGNAAALDKALDALQSFLLVVKADQATR